MYVVKGDAGYAIVVTRRINKDQILEQFKGEQNGKSAFERAEEWAIEASRPEMA